MSPAGLLALLACVGRPPPPPVPTPRSKSSLAGRRAPPLDAGPVLQGAPGSAFGVAIGAGGLLAGGAPALVVGAPDAEGVELFGPGPAWPARLHLQGQAQGDATGAALAVGDVDGDGIDDLVLGARGSDRGGLDAGAVYLLAGPLPDAGSLDIAQAEGQRVGDAAGDYLAVSLALGGVDEARGQELLVGAGRGGEADGGTALVLRGGMLASTEPVRLDWGLAGALFGSATELADLDGDGLDEALIGGFGADGFRGLVAVASSPLDADRRLCAEADARFEGGGAFDLAGQALAAADLDHDGLDDLVLSLPGDDRAGPEAGVVLVFSRPAGVLARTGAQAELWGAGDHERAGWALAAPGDLDGDGQDDLLIGSPGADAQAGAAWLAWGPLAGARGLSTETEARWTGPSPGAGLGARLAGLPDLDGDGGPELAFGAPVLDRAWLLEGAPARP